jgi:hypothetical protein
MKKIIITVLATIWLTSSAALAGSIQVGAKVSSAFIDASGNEKTTSGTVTGGAVNDNNAVADNEWVTIPSIYAEYSLDDASWASEGNGVTLGVNYTFGSADVSDVAKSRSDLAEDAAGSGSSGNVTYTAQAELENYVSYYIEMPLYQSIYVKAGMSQIDVVTKEDPDHHGTYGDASLDGIDLGFGFKGTYGSNYVWKVAYEQTNWDSLKLTSSTSNVITADIDTKEVAVSLGYRF